MQHESAVPIRLLRTLEQLLALPAIDTAQALDQASQLLANTLDADKVDVFLYEAASDSLIARGTSQTPMGERQHMLGLNRVALSNGGRAAEVFQTGQCYRTGNARADMQELRGVREALHIQSILVVPLAIGGVRRGVLQVDSAHPDHFDEQDLDFLEAAGYWVGSLFQRAELTEAVQQAALEQGRRHAASDLITILAHDLRGPLTTLRGHADLIRRRAQATEQAPNLRSAQAILASVARLERMITDLLDTARLEHGLFTIRPTVVDLAQLARTTAEVLQTPEIEVFLDAPEELVLEADPDRIRQALENLLSNAQKHAPQGSTITREVTTIVEDQAFWAVVTVRDQGPGIAPEVLPRLFTRFGTSAATTGLGLGLFLAHGIATAHGGTLKVDSVPGQGAAFCLTLPLSQPLPSD